LLNDQTNLKIIKGIELINGINKMPRHEKLRMLFYFIFVSLVLHLCFLFWVKSDPTLHSLNSELLDTLKVVLLSREIIPRQSMRNKKRQIVNNEQTGREVAPSSSRFYGEKNQTYEKETIPQEIGQFRAQGPPSAKKDRGNRMEKLKSLKMADLVIRKPKNLDQFAMAKITNHQALAVGLSKNSEGRNNDYIEGVNVGEGTNLNTHEYKFWGFYNRMRQRLEPNWEKLLDERIRRYYAHGRKVILANQTMTLIKITLDEEGNVFRMKVLQSSGLAEIDNIAIDAITMSGPFTSVPKQMLQDQLVEIEWGFVVRP